MAEEGQQQAGCLLRQQQQRHHSHSVSTFPSLERRKRNMQFFLQTGPLAPASTTIEKATTDNIRHRANTDALGATAGRSIPAESGSREERTLTAFRARQRRRRAHWQQQKQLALIPASLYEVLLCSVEAIDTCHHLLIQDR